LKDKTIILTGSIIPYVVAKSDAMFNVGSAVAYSQSLQHGTYVVMNGIAFDALNVLKNKETQQFQSLYKE
jgi:L-asparaginase